MVNIFESNNTNKIIQGCFSVFLLNNKKAIQGIVQISVLIGDYS
jgi:hypothetical protein